MISKSFQKIEALLPASSRRFELISHFYYLLILFCPPLVIPLYSYYQADWRLLLGIPFPYIGRALAAKGKEFIISVFSLACIFTWMSKGLEPNYLTFLYFCTLFGYAFGMMGDSYRETAKRMKSGQGK